MLVKVVARWLISTPQEAQKAETFCKAFCESFVKATKDIFLITYNTNTDYLVINMASHKAQEVIGITWAGKTGLEYPTWQLCDTKDCVI